MKDKDYVSDIDDEIKTQEETEAKFKYRDPQTNEVYEYDRKGLYRKDGRVLVPVND